MERYNATIVEKNILFAIVPTLKQILNVASVEETKTEK
jgi:hypothetical protein